MDDLFAHELLIVSGNTMQSGDARHAPKLDTRNKVLMALDETLGRCRNRPHGHKSIQAHRRLDIFTDPVHLAPLPAHALDRDEVGVTVKLAFLMDNTGIEEEAAMEIAASVLEEWVMKRVAMDVFHSKHIDEFLVSFPNLLSSSTTRDELTHEQELQIIPRLKPIMQTLQSMKERGVISRMGVADFTSRQLTALMDFCCKPDINQVNFDFENCCATPSHNLLQFCKAHNVELLTHGDVGEYPDNGMVRALMRKHGMLTSMPSASSRVNLDLLVVDESVATATSPVGSKPASFPIVDRSIHGEWIAQWSTRNKSRDLAISRHYIFKATCSSSSAAN